MINSSILLSFHQLISILSIPHYFVNIHLKLTKWELATIVNWLEKYLAVISSINWLEIDKVGIGNWQNRTGEMGRFSIGAGVQERG